MFTGIRNEIVRAKRAGEVVALGVVAMEVVQRGELRLGLDAFGDDPHVQ